MDFLGSCKMATVLGDYLGQTLSLLSASTLISNIAIKCLYACDLVSIKLSPYSENLNESQQYFCYDIICNNVVICNICRNL